MWTICATAIDKWNIWWSHWYRLLISFYSIFTQQFVWIVNVMLQWDNTINVTHTWWISTLNPIFIEYCFVAFVLICCCFISKTLIHWTTFQVNRIFFWNWTQRQRAKCAGNKNLIYYLPINLKLHCNLLIHGYWYPPVIRILCFICRKTLQKAKN